MSANFRSSYNELLASGIKYTHSGTPIQMRYRESEEHPSLEQIQRMQQQRELKHSVLQIKLNELNEDRPSTPAAFRQLPPEEIEQISQRLNDSKTTASTGQLDEVSARRLDRASHKDEAKRYGYDKSEDFDADKLVRRVTKPTVATTLKSDAVKFQFGDAGKYEVHRDDKPRAREKTITREKTVIKEKNTVKENQKEKEEKKELPRSDSTDSLDSMASNKTA